jgi:hypothetical protein
MMPKVVWDSQKIKQLLHAFVVYNWAPMFREVINYQKLHIKNKTFTMYHHKLAFIIVTCWLVELT